MCCRRIVDDVGWKNGVEKMNILAIGSVGLIVLHIVEHFLSEGHSVFVLDNLETGYIQTEGINS